MYWVWHTHTSFIRCERQRRNKTVESHRKWRKRGKVWCFIFADISMSITTCTTIHPNSFELYDSVCYLFPDFMYTCYHHPFIVFVRSCLICFVAWLCTIRNHLIYWCCKLYVCIIRMSITSKLLYSIVWMGYRIIIDDFWSRVHSYYKTLLVCLRPAALKTFLLDKETKKSLWLTADELSESFVSK